MQSARLVGDIGGTNARFALLDDNNTPQGSKTLPCRDFSNLHSAIEAFLQGSTVEQLHSAAVAVATPVSGDQVKLTNNHWSFSIEKTKQRLKISELHILNDFTAQALAVPHLQSNYLQQIGGGTVDAKAPVGILGAGTGLGVSGLVYSESGTWTPLQGEGGHVTATVRTQREFDLYQVLAARFGHVSAERYLSGPGLTYVHDGLRQLDQLPSSELSSAQITEAAMSGSDPYCVETLEIFCTLLGTCAADLALTLGAFGGIYIGGGIVPKLGDYFLQSSFRSSFEDKGRMRHLMEKTPTFIITDPYPALTGAAQLL